MMGTTSATRSVQFGNGSCPPHLHYLNPAASTTPIVSPRSHAMASLSCTINPLFYNRRTAAKPRRTLAVRAEAINPDIRKTEDKVVDSVPIAELAKPVTAYCRCWRSGTFPLCDGSHLKHNKATGDNVGPLLLKKQ